MQQPHEILGKVVRDARARLGLTQSKVAEDIGRSERTIIKIEHGQGNLKLDALFPLIRELKIDPSEIFYPENDPDNPAIQQLHQTIKDCTAAEAEVLTPIIDSVLTALRAKDQSEL